MGVMKYCSSIESWPDLGQAAVKHSSLHLDLLTTDWMGEPPTFMRANNLIMCVESVFKNPVASQAISEDIKFHFIQWLRVNDDIYDL